MSYIAELGDLRRFYHPEKLMAFLGLVPSEYSSEERTRKGSITKSGNGHARRTLIEAAHAYRFSACASRALLKRHEGLPESVRKIAWNAQVRRTPEITLR